MLLDAALCAKSVACFLLFNFLNGPVRWVYRYSSFSG